MANDKADENIEKIDVQGTYIEGYAANEVGYSPLGI